MIGEQEGCPLVTHSMGLPDPSSSSLRLKEQRVRCPSLRKDQTDRGGQWCLLQASVITVSEMFLRRNVERATQYR